MEAASSYEVLYYDTALPTRAVFEAGDNHAMTLKAPPPPILAVFWANALLRLQIIVAFSTNIVIARLTSGN